MTDEVKIHTTDHVEVRFTDANGVLVATICREPRVWRWLGRRVYGWVLRRLYEAECQRFDKEDGGRKFTYAIEHPKTGELVNVVPDVRLVMGEGRITLLR